MQQELEKYITETKEYGKPSDDAINHFINSTLASIIIDKPKRLDNKTIETNTNSKWLELVRNEAVNDIRLTAPLFSGGYDFYYYLSKQDIKDKQSLRIAIEQYTIPELPRINDSLRNILKQYNGVQIYQVSHVDGTYHYLVAQNNGDIKIYNENGTQLSNTIDIELVEHLKKISFKQKYLGTDINAFLNIPLNNISEFDLYMRCNSIENLSPITNQHNIIDNVAHANTSDTSMISGDSLEGDKAEQAERSYDSHSSTTSNIAEKAKSLDDEGIQQVTDEFIKKILNERQDVIDEIESRIEKHRKETEEQEKWKYEPLTHDGESTTKDIYSSDVLAQAKEILDRTHRLLIMGNTGDGKTELAKLLAHEYTQETISNNGEFVRTCITSARDADSLVGEGLKRYGLLDRFCKYIRDNNITEPCVLICNEVQASDFGYLVGADLWDEHWNRSEEPASCLPDNLYIILTGCTDRDFGIDTQITGRVESVEVKYVSKDNIEKHNKIIGAFGQEHEEKLRLAEEINDYEGYQVISFRNLLRLINGEKMSIINRSMLSNSSQTKLEKMENL